MKKTLIFVGLLGMAFVQLHAKALPITAKDRDIKIVETYIIDAQEWLQKAWDMKVAARREVMIKEEIERCRLNNESIPAGDDAIIDQALARPDYKTRKQKDEAGK